jgi:3-dehydrosphinganine reductase
MALLTLIVAGILALPAVLLTVVTAPLIALLSLPACYLLLARKKASAVTSATKQQRQVVVTGGSSGIGLAIALAAAGKKDVRRIVILARNQERLNGAKAAIVAKAKATDANNKIVVEAISLDVTDAAAVLKAAETIMKNCNDITTHLFCCAGEAQPAYFQDVLASTYEQIVQTNQLGSIYVSNAFLNKMVAGTVTLTSSMGGQVGVFGYTAYCPTKFALKGYAECVHMELVNNPDIHIQIAYPPDTDTPGFEKENIGKPTETVLISEVAGLASAEKIGQAMLREAVCEHPRFNVYFNFDGFLLSTLTAGFSPVSSLTDALAQVSMLSLTRWISLFYLADWHRIVRRHQSLHPVVAESSTKNDATTVTAGSKTSPSGSVKVD